MSAGSPDGALLRMQEALLPSSVPLLPGADVAASYGLAHDPERAGGDWFDAGSLPDGRLAMSVGDVVGCGMAAASVMVQLRAVLSARLFEGATTLEAVDAAEHLAARVSGAFATTMTVAVLDPATGELEYVTRGHPAPIVVGPHGPRMLPATGDGPIGTRTHGRFCTTTVNLDEVLVLYSDGLYEHAGLRNSERLDELVENAQALAAGDATAVPRLVAELPLLQSPDGFADDVTVLAVRRRAAPKPLELTLTAAPERLSTARASVETWALGIGLGTEDRRRLVLGVSELMANAIEHAYRDEPAGPVRVFAQLTDRATVEATVIDEGRWREPSAHPGDRGRGLSMSAALGLRVTVGSGGTGTRATIETPARRELLVLGRDPQEGRRLGPAQPPRITVETDELAVVRVSGTLGTRSSAAHVEAEVRRVSRNGLVPVRLDLRDVTHLGSPGLAAIESLLGPDGPGQLMVVADDESAAADTMRLVGTPFESAGRG